VTLSVFVRFRAPLHEDNTCCARGYSRSSDDGSILVFNASSGWTDVFEEEVSPLKRQLPRPLVTAGPSSMTAHGFAFRDDISARALWAVNQAIDHLLYPHQR
jgi:hypothetical protein